MNVSTFLTLINKSNERNALIHYWRHLAMQFDTEQRNDLRREAFYVLRSLIGSQSHPATRYLPNAMENKELIYSLRNSKASYWDTVPESITITQARKAITAAYNVNDLTVPSIVLDKLTDTEVHSTTCSLPYLIELVTQHVKNDPDAHRVLDEVILNHPMRESTDSPQLLDLEVVLGNGLELSLTATSREYNRLKSCDGVYSCKVVTPANPCNDSL